MRDHSLKERLIALSKKKAVVKSVEVEGEEVFVRYLDSGDLFRWDKLDLPGKVALLLCDADGNRVFGDGEEGEVLRLDRSIFRAVLEVGLPLNYPTEEEEAEEDDPKN